MINDEKWINSLPNSKSKMEENKLNPNKWTNTIPKKNHYNSVKKYSFLAALFVSGLLLVSAVKNETRNLQKEINHLEADLNKIEYNLNQAILDHEVITAPGHISKLAKEYLNTNLGPYKRSQIKNLTKNENNFFEIDKANAEIYKNKVKKMPKKVRIEVAKKIKNTKVEIRKLQELYNQPKLIPTKIKGTIAKKIKEKKFELKNIYLHPNETVTMERARQWSIVQLVKLVLGFPIVPGR